MKDKFVFISDVARREAKLNQALIRAEGLHDMARITFGAGLIDAWFNRSVPVTLFIVTLGATQQALSSAIRIRAEMRYNQS